MAFVLLDRNGWMCQFIFVSLKCLFREYFTDKQPILRFHLHYRAYRLKIKRSCEKNIKQ